ncbi:MAG: hypothetical protein HRT82_15855 [Henriciella sp.]|nr:hypothetical protein [Henriciella sp.]
MPEPNRQRLETALQNAHNAGDTEAAKLLAAEIRKLDAAPGINITPAAETTPGQRVQQRMDEITPMAAAAAQRQIATSPVNPDVQMNIVIDPESGLPMPRGQSTSEAWQYGDYNPGATFMDYVDTSNPWSQRATVLQRGSPLGAGDEIIGAVAGENAEQVADDLYARAYAERPLESFILEGLSTIPTGGLIAKGLARAGAGPRTIAAAEGAIYGFNDPFIGGDSLESRALNAVPSAIGGRVVGGIGTSTVNVGRRLNNRVSGNPTIQSVAQDDFGITLTEGQITQDVGKQSFERDARKGSKGADAAQVAIQAFKDQEAATLNAGRSIGGDRFATSNQAAGDFLSGVQGRIQTQQEAINQAYDRARGFNATLSPEGSQSMPQAVVGGLDNDLLQQIEIDPEGFKQLHPNTAAALRSVASLGNAGRDGGLPFEQLETTRRIINNAISASAQNPADKRAAMQVKASFDRFVDDAVDQALFDSDDAFISAYREARGLRAQFAEDWEANKVFKRLIESDATPEMAINFVLGGGRLAGDNQMVVLRQLKTALKDDPETIAALQEAYMKKIMRQTEKTFNPKVLRESLDELLIGKNESFAKALLDDDQYAQLRKFRAVVDSLVPMDGTVNTSNTAAALERTKGAVTDFLTGPMRSGPVRATGRFMNELLGKYIVKTGGSRARQQFNPPAGLDTRRIESGYPAGSFSPPSSQLPGSGGSGPSGGGPANAFNTQSPATPQPAPQNAFAPEAKPVQSGVGAIAGPELGGAVVGGAAGATQGETLEERGRNAFTGAVSGALVGRVGRRVAGRAAPAAARTSDDIATNGLGSIRRNTQQASEQGFQRGSPSTRSEAYKKTIPQHSNEYDQMERLKALTTVVGIPLAGVAALFGYSNFQTLMEDEAGPSLREIADRLEEEIRSREGLPTTPRLKPQLPQNAFAVVDSR